MKNVFLGAYGIEDTKIDPKFHFIRVVHINPDSSQNELYIKINDDGSVEVRGDLRIVIEPNSSNKVTVKLHP